MSLSIIGIINYRVNNSLPDCREPTVSRKWEMELRDSKRKDIIVVHFKQLGVTQDHLQKENQEKGK
jgi:hypothetical protein